MIWRRIFGEPLSFDWKVVGATVAATLLLMVDAYHRLTINKGYDRLILYLIVPLVIIIIAFRENPKAYGFSLGDWKLGLVLTVASIVLIAPVLWFVARWAAR